MELVMAMCIRCAGGSLGNLDLCLDCINDDMDAHRSRVRASTGLSMGEIEWAYQDEICDNFGGVLPTDWEDISVILEASRRGGEHCPLPGLMQDALAAVAQDALAKKGWSEFDLIRRADAEAEAEGVYYLSVYGDD
jgi:hypothetical protein